MIDPQATVPHDPEFSQNTVPSRAVDDGRTVPNQAVPRAPATAVHQPVMMPRAPLPPAPSPAPVMPPQHPVYPPQSTLPNAAPRLPIRQKPARTPRKWGVLIAGAVGIFMLVSCMASALGMMLVYNSGILPGVSVGGVALGGLSEQEAAQALRSQWGTLALIDGGWEGAWSVTPSEIGLTLNAGASAARAFAQGRSEGNFFEAMRGAEIEPVLSLDVQAALAALASMRDQIETPAVNAGVQWVNGTVSERPASTGRALNVEATVAGWRDRAAKMLAADGALSLVMDDIAPSVTSAAGMVEAARALLANNFSLRVFDPVTGDQVYWDASPQTWANWLTSESDPASATGLKLTLDLAQVTGFLDNSAGQSLDASRYIDSAKAARAMQDSLDRGVTAADVRVYHRDRVHTVQAGETIISIAWDYGVPYPWVQKANGGIENVSIGQQITIPSPDNFLQFEPVPDKRIEVSISEQRVRVYENGGLKWDWVASTGINSSPTWPGLYQIISHEQNAYAGNWNLWMPWFMGVYQPIPGANFTNGFHGFPTRGGGQLLWENSLGTKVTYGCILLSNTNVQQLYNWAEDGVVVEILP